MDNFESLYAWSLTQTMACGNMDETQLKEFITKLIKKWDENEDEGNGDDVTDMRTLVTLGVITLRLYDLVQEQRAKGHASPDLPSAFRDILS